MQSYAGSLSIWGLLTRARLTVLPLSYVKAPSQVRKCFPLVCHVPYVNTGTWRLASAVNISLSDRCELVIPTTHPSTDTLKGQRFTCRRVCTMYSTQANWPNCQL